MAPVPPRKILRIETCPLGPPPRQLSGRPSGMGNRRIGFQHFDRCMAGEEVTEYHLQAAIAATYARASEKGSIEWAQILFLYDRLQAMNPSPVAALNRAVVVGKVRGANQPQAAGLLSPAGSPRPPGAPTWTREGSGRMLSRGAGVPVLGAGAAVSAAATAIDRAFGAGWI
jgi:hypothetical protein